MKKDFITNHHLIVKNDNLIINNEVLLICEILV